MHTDATASKYRTLTEAGKHAVQIIPTLYIRASTPATQAAISEFIHTHNAPHYLVRSAVVAEDGTDRSYAGMFYTAPPVEATEVLTTISAVQTENTRRVKELGLTAAAHVMLCPYIKTTYGGVTFAPWLYFHQHCVTEWAESAEAAVAGQTLGTTAVDLDSGEAMPIIGTALPTAVAKALAFTIKQLLQIFSHPRDVEWGYDGSQLYVFQIRPITITPTAFTPSTTPLAPTLMFDQYSDTFGKLSPLSYSLFSTLYTESALYTKTLGVHGDTPFLHRLPTGEIVTDSTALKRYFHSRGWFATVLRPTRITLALRASPLSTPTDSLPTLEALITAFTLWQLASLSTRQSAPYAQPHEYELSQTIDINQYPVDSLVAKYKKDFLSLTIPIRTLVQKQPAYLWGSVTELLTGTPPTNWEAAYHEELAHSFMTSRTNPTATQNRLLWGAPVTGTHLHIADPLAWHKPLPPQTIVSTPFIPAHWILELPKLAGLVTTSMSQLSHAAITLREHDIPTLLVTEVTLANLKDTSHLSLETAGS